MGLRANRLMLILVCHGVMANGADNLGQLSRNPYAPQSTANPYGAGNPYDPNSVANKYGKYGSPYSNQSVNNPYATDAPKLYDSQGNYRGKLSSNPHDPDSVSNPYGRYGSKFSPESINNPYGARSRYEPSSPNNPYGNGLRIQGSGSAPNQKPTYGVRQTHDVCLPDDDSEQEVLTVPTHKPRLSIRAPQYSAYSSGTEVRQLGVNPYSVPTRSSLTLPSLHLEKVEDEDLGELIEEE